MILKNLGDLDKKKPYFNKLAMPAGFNFVDIKNHQTKGSDINPNINPNPNTYNNDKATIDDNIFSKLFGLIDTSKKQVTKKARGRSQKKSRKNYLRKI